MFYPNFARIAYRYLQVKTAGSPLNFMLKICFAGITIATCAVALVISIIHGFEQATYQKMQSIYPDIIIESKQHGIDMDLLTPLLQQRKSQIKSFAPEQTSQLIMCDSEQQQSAIMVQLKAIVPKQEIKVSKLQEKIISPAGASLEKLLTSNHIIIGSKLQETFNLSCGDKAYILYTDDEPSALQINFEKSAVIIAGVFKTGIEEFDNNVAYCSAAFFNDLFPCEDIYNVHIKCQPHIDQSSLIHELKELCDTDVYSWSDLYPALLSALKLEKIAMFIILMLIVLVATMNIASLIFMFITYKKRDLSIFICLGMPVYSIRLIFITMSSIISILATGCGLLLALIIGTILHTFPFIQLPDNVYDTDYLPIQMDHHLFLAIFIITIMISLLASIVATANITKINIVETLKNQ